MATETNPTSLLPLQMPHSRSQHHPSLIRHDALVQPTPCSSLPHWTIGRKPLCDDFTKDIRKMLVTLPEPDTPDIDDAYNQFTYAIIPIAKRHIPRDHRKTHIPGWDNECDEHHAAKPEQEFLMHLNKECQNWLRVFKTNFMQRTKIPNIWRCLKSIAILKLGKMKLPIIDKPTIGFLQTSRVTDLQSSAPSR